MIGLLIQDNQYEQDIRELLMSFTIWVEAKQQ